MYEESDVQKRIQQARTLVDTVNNAAMATVNSDGSPHNTPYFFMKSADLQYIYWSSHPDSQHSQNVARTGQVFVVLFDAAEGAGLYIQANQGHVTQKDALRTAINVHNDRRLAVGKTPIGVDQYIGDSPQRMYRATVQKIWIHGPTRNEEGLAIPHSRIEIQPEDLIRA